MKSSKTILQIFFLLITTNIFCQEKVVTEQEPRTQEDCREHFAGLEIFKVVETPPLIKSIDSEAIEESLISTVKKLRLDKGHKSIVTLKMFFPIKGAPCIHSIEIEGDILRDKKVQQLTDRFRNITEYESGRQRNRSVICEAIIDIIIKKGRLRDLQYTNLRFE